MKLKSFNLLVAIVAMVTLANAQISTPPSGNNQRSVTKQYIGKACWVKIDYNSPDVTGPNGQSREGQIWGQLVPYGFNSLGFGISTPDNPSPWRAGANENTVIEFSHNMKIQGKDIAAGKYGFHVVPMEEGPWTIILSKDYQAWGSYFYTPDRDALRVEASPEESEYREWLTFEFVDRQPNSTTIALIWENLKLPFKVEVPNINEITLATLKAEMQGQLGFSHLNLAQAANWASGAGYHEEAMAWAESAVSLPGIGQKDFTTLSTKANVFRNAGKEDEFVLLMDEAIRMDGATPFQIHAFGRQLIAAGQKDKALEIFKYNLKKFEGAWPTNYGMARGYSAKGDFKNAIKYLKKAQQNVPAGDTANPPIIEANLEKLAKGEDIN